jgi:hypothetical protein
MRRSTLLLGFLAAFLATGAPRATVTRADTAGLGSVDQTMPAIAYNPRPEQLTFLLVWIEDRGAGYDLYAKRLFANGLPQGGASRQGWQVLRAPDGSGRAGRARGPRADPAIFYGLARDEYMLVYSELVDEENGWDVFALRISPAGYAVGDPRRLAGGPGDQRHPDLAPIGDDRSGSDDYLVVWEDNTRDVDEVWALRLQANGNPRGAAYPLVRGPASAADPTTSGTAVAWVDDRNGQSDIYSLRLRNGRPNGKETAVTLDPLEEFNPRYGSSGLIWNVYDPMAGIDIMGIEVIENNLARGGPGVILVPAADQVAPDMDNGVLVFADNRIGDFDLYAVRVIAGGRLRVLGHDYPVLTDQ